MCEGRILDGARSNKPATHIDWSQREEETGWEANGRPYKYYMGPTGGNANEVNPPLARVISRKTCVLPGHSQILEKYKEPLASPIGPDSGLIQGLLALGRKIESRRLPRTCSGNGPVRGREAVRNWRPPRMRSFHFTCNTTLERSDSSA